MTTNNMIDAVINQPKPPCEKFACKMVKQCASEKLACDAFVYYTRFPTNSKVLHPNTLIINKGLKGGGRQDQFYQGRICPSKRKYRMAMK